MASAWDERAVRALFGKEKTARLLAQGLLKEYYTDQDGLRFFHRDDVFRHYAYKQPDQPLVGCCECCHRCSPPTYEAAAGGVIVKALSANAQKLLDALDRLGGDHVSLVKLRPAAGLGGSFDAALNELRRAGLVGMAAAEGRYGVSQAERDAALREYGEMLLFASRKDYEPDIADEDYPQEYLEGEGDDDQGDEDEADYEESVEDEDEDEDGGAVDDDEDDFDLQSTDDYQGARLKSLEDQVEYGADNPEPDEPGDGGEVDDLGGASMDGYIDQRIAALDAEEKMAAALADQADNLALANASLGLAVGHLRLRQAVAGWLGGG
jgi:hypothetical protein